MNDIALVRLSRLNALTLLLLSVCFAAAFAPVAHAAKLALPFGTCAPTS